MNTLFARGPSLQSRLYLALFMSVVLMAVDLRLDGFSSVRMYLSSLVSPLQYIANVPGELLNWTTQRVTSQQKLLEENSRLKSQHMIMSEALQRFNLLENENERLRALLGSPVRKDVRKMVAELMAVDNDPFSHQIVINKGAIDGVYEGQPVLDDNGVVGQVLHVASTNSRVLLISDFTHAIPVRVARNDVRAIASGSGQLNALILNHVPHSTDIVVGDLLFSSGLGHVFPEGYPVAKVSQIEHDESQPFATIVATPVAELDRIKYLLLLWPHDSPSEPVQKRVESDES
ncbi:rod shape-determining protein MreC [Neptunicella sp. SCSIO 80796]|uniref:rod shape-determining protein MreC n=1 Tax=Neptunicella plasticusilytica TaxID=3117012 RepID=UPI003A4D83CD